MKQRSWLFWNENINTTWTSNETSCKQNSMSKVIDKWINPCAPCTHVTHSSFHFDLNLNCVCVCVVFSVIFYVMPKWLLFSYCMLYGSVSDKLVLRKSACKIAQSVWSSATTPTPFNCNPCQSVSYLAKYATFMEKWNVSALFCMYIIHAMNID